MRFFLFMVGHKILSTSLCAYNYFITDVVFNYITKPHKSTQIPIISDNYLIFFLKNTSQYYPHFYIIIFYCTLSIFIPINFSLVSITYSQTLANEYLQIILTNICHISYENLYQCKCILLNLSYYF